MGALPGLDEFFGPSNKFKPELWHLAQYAFWEKGISLEEFNRLPIPYILDMMRTAVYFSEKQKESMDKK